MILFYQFEKIIYVVDSTTAVTDADHEKFVWLFSGANRLNVQQLEGAFIGPRKEMITPWSTNAVEITQNMGIDGINRIEEFVKVEAGFDQYDPMLKAYYEIIGQDIYSIDKKPAPIIFVDDIAAYNKQEGLALSSDEIKYLENVAKKIDRKLTDSEVFGFSQVNSEHCRHKIFNGKFIIDAVEKKDSLFGLIKKTAKDNPNFIVSAYKDNVAFIEGPEIELFAPVRQDIPDFFHIADIESVVSLKAETHNFPTTVEPFNGAATGSGGEIRDRMAGGKGSLPIAGTAVYMTSYSRLEKDREWEATIAPRKWLYQSPDDILVKASNGASDFGNKFGQPLICGSVLTFEHTENDLKWGYDKVIMLAGGVGFGKKQDSLKDEPSVGDKVIVMGGDNYRIGMGGGAVSSVDTGQFANAIELNAVQRSNPEMQKRVLNAIRAMVESDVNPIVSIHDHGAGGHLNALSELLEATGGYIDMNKLPVGDPTLSSKEIIGNESQERMGLIMKEKDIALLQKISERERAPMYVVGEATGDHKFVFKDEIKGNPIDWEMGYMFGKPPKTVIQDSVRKDNFNEPEYNLNKLDSYIKQLLQIESVACKDWLTNKVDRSVTGKVAKQQTCGIIQLPLNDVAVVALDYQGKTGIATSIGHAPIIGMIDPVKGSVMSIAEALTNLVFAPLQHGLKGVSLSANWMWPCKNAGEDARLYDAVEAASNFACKLGINIPTGKDSLSMTQKYGDEKVMSPGTVIISATAVTTDVRKTVGTALIDDMQSSLIYIDLSCDEFKLGGSSFYQIFNAIGKDAPTVKDVDYFSRAFAAIQKLLQEDMILSGHDISAGGLFVALLEMCFPHDKLGLSVNLSTIPEKDIIKILFSENPGILIQVHYSKLVVNALQKANLTYFILGQVNDKGVLSIKKDTLFDEFKVNALRDIWYKTSYLLDRKQSGPEMALERFNNYKLQPLRYMFNDTFKGTLTSYGIDTTRRNFTGVKAAIIREKGVNGDREMAYSMHLAGFDVKDVHMTDLISGRETLEDINFIVFVGGFSNSDVLGSAKGWAGAFLFNEKAKQALDNFYSRSDTMSLGICNGCQLMVELGLIYPEHDDKPKMHHNDSHKFESAFISLDIIDNESVMLGSLSGSSLGAWVAHGEGKFYFPYDENRYLIPVKYTHAAYPGNPNGSTYSAAAIVSKDGRHLAMMPHLERAIFPWQWPYYSSKRNEDEVTPWIEAFVNARNWIIEKTQS